MFSADEYLLIYDNGGETIDRFSVWYLIYTDYGFYGVSMSAQPYHPQGIGQHDHNRNLPPDFAERDFPDVDDAHGRRIRFAALPDDCQRVVINDLRELGVEV